MQNLKLFISEYKAYFDTVIRHDVSFNWDDDSWSANTQNKGVFSGAKTATLNFNKLTTFKKGIYFEGDNEVDLTVGVHKEFRDFIKAFMCYLIKLKNRKVSMSALNRDLLLIKKVYIQLLVNGHIKPDVHVINNDIILHTMTAHCTAIAKKTNGVADSQTAMRSLCKRLTVLAVTLTPISFNVTQKRASSEATAKAKEAAEKFHNAEYVEETDEDDSDKLISIQTFLNIVALRSMVSTDGEKILLNMLLLLMVTGFRFGECARLRTDSLKKLEIDDSEAINILKEKGLTPYYLGIKYVGEKSAGTRTHWVEPLAISLVEIIYEDTLKLTKKLRTHISECRKHNFNTLLPIELQAKIEIPIDDITDYIVESLSETAQKGESQRRDFTNRALKKAKIEPLRIEFVNSRRKVQYYSARDIETYLQERVLKSKSLSSDFILNFQDSKTGKNVRVCYEDILFIAPEGSLALIKTQVIKPLPALISIHDMSKFLGAADGQSGTSIFKKYGLTDENGNHPSLTTHMPRHTINTFLAIAGITDHIQAAIMGRVDITQNSAYQHLAIQERAMASDASFSGNQLDIFDKTVTVQEPSSSNPMELIKETAQISINPDLNLANGIAQNTHSFTTTQDVTSLVSDVFESSGIDLMAGLGVASANEQSNELIERHAYLYSLDFGSCMRNLKAWSCPYSMRCQDGSPCPYFTVIGRADDQIKLESKRESLRNQLREIELLFSNGDLSLEEYQELSVDFKRRRESLMEINVNSNKIEATKQKINLIEFDHHKKPKSLATIFAIEHRKKEHLEKAKS